MRLRSSDQNIFSGYNIKVILKKVVTYLDISVDYAELMQLLNAKTYLMKRVLGKLHTNQSK